MSYEFRALLYLRVSTGKQKDKGIALPTQQEQCLTDARERDYFVDEKTDIYIDGKTGTNADRHALMDLLNRCKEDKSVKAVIVYDVSRLARDRIDFALIKQTLRKAGVKLISATEPIDETPEGQMLEGVLSTVAEFFSAQSGRKVSANMRRKAETGGWPNLAPYGYCNRREKLPGGAVRAWIEPDPSEAVWVKRAFELFGTGIYSVKSLTRQLNNEGFPARKSRNRRTRQLHASQLERLLRNKIYVGVIEWKGVVNKHGNHEHLLAPELFYRVQDLLVLRAGSTTRMRRHRSLFKRLALCDECKSAMTIDIKQTAATRAIRYLRCRKAKHGQPVQCGQRYFSEEVYTTQLARLLRLVELPTRAIEKLQDVGTNLCMEEERVYVRVREELGKQLEAVRRRRANLLVRTLDDDPHDESQRSVYQQVRTELEEEETRITNELGRLKLKLEGVVRTVKMALAITGCLVRAFAADDDPDYRGLVARAIFSEVRMRDGTIVGARLAEPLVFIRRWIGEKPLGDLADLGLPCAHNGALVEGSGSCHQQHLSVDDIREDLYQLQGKLTVEQLAYIEACYRELRGRGLLSPGTEASDVG
jgi:site-specific DNA recombinase